jgi:hypothetical protein
MFPLAYGEINKAMTFVKIKNKVMNLSQYLGNKCYLPIVNMRKVKYKKKIIIYTLAYGDYLDYYFDYSLPAIMHESNYGALIKEGFEMEFLLYTIDGKKSIIEKYVDHPFFDFERVSIVEFDAQGCSTPRKIASHAIIDVINRSVGESSVLFMAAPDTIISNGSLFNAVSTCFGKNVCLASAHARVSTNVLAEIEKCNSDGVDSSKMVSLSFKYAHGNFKYADENLYKNTTQKGISYKKISKNIYTVSHNLPSPWLVFPIKEDCEFFQKCQDFNMWDREWLQMLIKTNRIKVSGSSDLYCAIEITPVAFIANEELKENQKYNDVGGNSFHHRVCRTFTSVWRTE